MATSNFDLLSAAFETNNNNNNTNSLLQQQLTTITTTTNKTNKALNNQNIIQRAIEIGMDPLKDTKLFWIAEQSLKAKLPEEWIECKTEDDQVYYYNLRNEDSTWEHPSLDHYRQLYERVKKQQTESKNNKSSLPEIGSRESTTSVSNINMKNDVTPNNNNSNTSNNNEINQKSRESTQSPRGVTLKQKKEAERLGGDASFWRTRYEMIETERDKINAQVKKLEQDLQANLLQGARLVEENHRLRSMSEDIAGKLRTTSSTIIKHLGKRGFKNDPRKGAGDVDLPSAVEDILKVIATHIEIDEGDRDENGFSINWDGGLARIKKELDFCFTYEGENYTIDMIELKVKLEDLTQMLVSYGEYLSQSDREGYINLFLDHVIHAAKDSTMVPLEMISKAGVKEINHNGRSDVLLDSPLIINNLRKELEEEKVLTKSLGLDLDQKRHEIDVLNMKITGLQSRLDDNRSHEEMLIAKFNLLNKSIEDIKLGNELSKEKTSLAEKITEVNKLKNEIKTLNNQLNIANKRASDSERRLEESITRETKMKSELTAIEMNLKLKLDKKKVAISELLEQKNDLEKVSQELYEELQNALMVTTRLEKDNDGLRDLLDEYRAGDSCVDTLREKLEIEYERNRKMEEQVTNLRHDFSVMKNAYQEMEKKNQKLEFHIMEYRENLAGLQYELEKQKKRTDVLTRDNLTLEESTKGFKHQIMSLNDRIVEIKGSIRVYCRVRPLFLDELNELNLSEADIESMIRYPDYNLIDFNSCPFEFDRVFDPKTTQQEIYDEAEAFIRSVVNGSRVCIFAYGITTSGKTHTLEGTEADPGVIYRSIHTLLETTNHQEEYHTDITISLMEVYNEKIRDLLSLEVENADFSLEIKVGTNGTYVDGLSEWPIRCYEEGVSLLKKGINNRYVLSSVQPNRLIRSHFIVLIKVHRTKMSTGQTTIGSLYFVDLAGSERAKLSTVTGMQLREAQNINKSLNALGDVISSLSENHKHVPYRNSKLTFLLQDALKDNSKVLMFIMIIPSPVHTGESMSALQFGARCRSIEFGHTKKVISHYSAHR